MSGLLPVDEALSRVLALAEPVDTETLPIANVAGRWLSADVAARRIQPAVNLSAMDGYAIRFAECPGPWTVVGESAAGSAFDQNLAPGEAARIFTGAPVPNGADTVVMQEETARNGDALTLEGEGPRETGAHIRRKGRDFSEGDVLLHAGARISPAALALAISGGHGTLPVRRTIRVALISTGDELVPAGQETGFAQLPASNGPMLAAQLAPLPVEIRDMGIVPDTLEALANALDASQDVDIIVTIGGASVGDYDLVQPALKAAGATMDFWRIAMKPGKPLMAGKLGKATVIGLPGNPASAFVTAKLFLEPLIAHLCGAHDPTPRFRPARLAAALPATGKRTEYLRGRWQAGTVEPLLQQSSAALGALAEAELLIHRPAGSAPAQTGDEIEILPIA
ncbi:gephyrin-like molybdotransferase Glp [Parasphingopyxis lamellibrachiae]|uniref:Molybdopterin molybdenumtransferase n=1 Tax=Parasphingopyxis lamellibrachiae TaxID=680125 RepID=A0A3D9FCD0_9SPHN|nr:gephyrin-like molybdotransferase Glp [Parasphingopyxis lamellibrachiae]RED15393.1 molybdopterin molybdochelatase [Parasphingopyxis lamellibrachiae]